MEIIPEHECHRFKYLKRRSPVPDWDFFFNLSQTMFRRRQCHPTPVLLPGKSHGRRSLDGCSPQGHEESDTTERVFTFTFHFHALEKEMATHSSVLAWRIPGTGEPGGLTSMGSHRVGHDWSDLAAAAAGIKGKVISEGELYNTPVNNISI